MNNRNKRRSSGPRDTIAVETVAAVVAIAAVASLALWLPDAQALDVLACIRFALGQGCLP